MSLAVLVAFYARVSSDQQANRGTIESQIAALHLVWWIVSMVTGLQISKTDHPPKR
jgi:site-specific DNA recombinase